VNGNITIDNSGVVFATNTAVRLFAVGSNLVNNSGTIAGGAIGVFASSPVDNDINNTGLITAASLFAIDTVGASTEIDNSGDGVILGFIDLTDEGDTFVNRDGGRFEARLTSDFRLGDDLFDNRQGGVVHTADDPGVAEITTFINLETFRNRGRISLVDGQEDDLFIIANTPGLANLEYIGGGALAVDSFLGGPGSTSDIFFIDGNVTDRTRLFVNNTNPGPGQLNTEGIPVVLVTGDVSPDAFFLPQPIDTGFFDYDLFFEPGTIDQFELRSFPGAGAHLLPQLVTAAQDIFHATTETWFDRTADLRVMLNAGYSPYYNSNAKYAEGMPAPAPSLVPGVWIKGSGNWLQNDDRASTTAFGKTFDFNLDRELDIFNIQAGVDLGVGRDIFSPNDLLIVGLLGGFVRAELEYDNIARSFDFEGGEAGGYITYLNRGLFIDTLAKGQFLDVETAALGFPNSFDANTWGVRTDAGYRFGGFQQGIFIEPLATIAVASTDLDGFSLAGNTVSFDEDTNVRGRLGLRVGTSRQMWSGVTVEPFVIGSVWGHLSDDENNATLVSNGTTFAFSDDLPDVWGEVSVGVNLFKPSINTSAFIKADVSFGEDLEGVAGKAGMRYNW
jgi:outer membrane autotransporter protein